VMERLQEIVAESPQYPLLAYNLACLESLTGHRDEALEHLGRAIAMSDRFRDYAKGDSDLDPIRDDARFVELIGE
jgi:thioredoxin-like negative regulator of GroEL